MILLQGKRVILREITEEDSETVVRWRNAELGGKVFFSDEVLTVERQLEWMKAYRQNLSDRAFIIEKDRRPIGMVSLYNIHEDKAEFGRLLIGETEFRGQGFAKEASKMVLDYGFNKLGLKSIYARVFEDNEPAVRLYLSLGFKVIEKEMNKERRVILNMFLNRTTTVQDDLNS
jgi:RimJ/RimL family protein N-acetyltransferase